MNPIIVKVDPYCIIEYVPFYIYESIIYKRIIIGKTRNSHGILE